MGTDQPSAEEIRTELARVLDSGPFTGARRSADVLRFIVEETLAGRGDRLKEYAIGADALKRGSAFDPKSDPIARVEASRLRSRLDLYNATEGVAGSVRIALPKGQYVPVFAFRTAAPMAASVEPPPSSVPVSPLHRFLPALAAGSAVLLLGVIAILAWPRPAAATAGMPIHFEMSLGAPVPVEFGNTVGNQVALSPDGQTLVFAALGPDGGHHLYLRQLDGLDAKELPGTLGGVMPFFSPDGRWVGFFADGAYKKVLIDGGGTPLVLATSGDSLGATWGYDGFIYAVMDRSNSLWKIPETGGQPVRLALSGPSTDNPRWPFMLPDGKHLLVTATAGLAADTSIDLARISDGQRTTLVRRGSYGRYTPSGHLLYVDRGTLFAAPFDLTQLSLKGAPQPVVRQVAHDAGYGHADYDVSANGTLVYLRDPSDGLSIIQRVTPDGATPVLSEPGRYLWPRLSPDGSRLAFSQLEGSDYDLWTLDLRNGERMRLTRAVGGQSRPLWTPDGRWLIYTEDASPAIWAMRSDGSGEPIKLASGVKLPFDISRTGKHLVFSEPSENTGPDAWTASVTIGEGGPELGERALFRQTPGIEVHERFSPDGNWIAYSSSSSGIFEIYVRAFPDRGYEQRVSVNGGRVPFWSSNNELIFETNDNRLMSVGLSTKGGKVSVGSTKLWSPIRLARTGVLGNYDIARDGKSIIALVGANQDSDWRPDHINVILNFSAQKVERQ